MAKEISPFCMLHYEISGVFKETVYKTLKLTNGQEVILNWYKREDIPEIVQVLNEVITEDRYLFLNNPITDMEKEYQWFDQGEKEGRLYLTARVNDRFVGGASIHPEKDKHRHIGSYGIFIDKEHRNLGLGTLLTKEFIEIAKKRGFEILQLSVYASNKRAFHVYQKCGFKQAGVLTRGIKFLDGSYADEILMELLLR